MLTGSCHCGALKWTLEGDPGSITACNCTLCRRYGVLWAYDYENERIKISGPELDLSPLREGSFTRDPLLPDLRLCAVLARAAARQGRAQAHCRECPAR